MYNPQKDFSKEFTRCIVAPLKALGFKKFKSNNIIRLSSENILQSINFQKSRWGGDFFYVNINVIPLQYLRQSFFGEGGIRIESLTQDFETDSFNFSHQLNAQASLREIQVNIEEKVIPWLNMLSTPQGILDFESTDNESIRKSIFPHYYHSLFFKEVRAFLYLSIEEFSTAHDLLQEGGRMEKDSSGEKSIFVRDKKYDFLISIIENQDCYGIKSLIQGNIKTSIRNLKLDPLEAFPVEVVPSFDSIAEVFSKIRTSQKIPGKGGVSYHHMILNVNPNSLSSIYEQLKKDFKYPISWFGKNRIVVQVNENYCFYFCLNAEEYVMNDAQEVASRYQGSKNKELIASSKVRIDFWGGDDSYRVEHINTYMFLLDSVKKLNPYIYWVKNNIFYDEI